MEDRDEVEDYSSPDENYSPSKMHSVIRPHSAKPKKNSRSSGKALRPWTAHAKTRASVSPKKIVRENLRQSHMRAPSKSSRKTPPATQVDDQVTSVLGLENVAIGYTPQTYKLPTEADSEQQDAESSEQGLTNILDHGVKTLMSDDVNEEESPREGWSLTQLKEKPKDPPNAKLKRHPSFETWVMGSPHDSDEYDTDLEADMLKKEEKPVDPTGKTAYKDQCKKEGLIPVSYLFRHLGDRNLRMRHHYLGGTGTKPIARALEFNTITENLDLGDNYLEADGTIHLCRMLKDNMFIVSLDISNNFIQSRGARAVGEMLEENTTLKTLSLAGNQLTDRDTRYFIDALKTTISLTSLDLSNNDFGEMGGYYLGSALAVNESITDLDLSWNAIRNKGAEAVAKALSSNSVLEILDLSWNGLGLPGAKALKMSLKVNTKLKVLDISNNRINKEAAKELSQGISKNVGLESLLMNLNPLGDEGLEIILKSVSQNQNLSYVSLEEIWPEGEAILDYWHPDQPFQLPSIKMEMNLSVANFKSIQEIEANREITILHGGIGGSKRYTLQSSVLKVLSKFLQDRRMEMEDAFAQQDKDHSGTLQEDELKLALKEAGLRLTNRQLDILIDEIDSSHSGTIKYKDILSGKFLSDYNKRRSSQAYKLPVHGNQGDIFGSLKRRQLTVA